MEAKLYSFIDIFNSEFNTDQEIVRLEQITIPIIQRDYAQGRNDPSIERIRDRFLNSLYAAVTKKPIILDFIYGDIDKFGNMTPLDGQQRLTTLFLLYWYAAKKENISENEYSFLNKFSYDTRYSARTFCKYLVKFCPSFEDVLSNEIIDQEWFPLDWKKDSTISSMLVMLDAIDEKFKDVEKLWQKLKNKSIMFYFLPIKDMGLTDELYIKMNSRGKPLTIFEHFKAELERNIRIIDENLADNIIYKIDQDWTNLLWRYRNSHIGSEDDNIIDDEFLRYFKFICDIICYKNKENPKENKDEFDLLQKYFSPDNPDVLKNLSTMEAFFDCWCNLSGYNTPFDFFKSFMSYKHEFNKIIVESRFNIDILGDCLHTYSDRNGRIRLFPLNRMVLLYAIIFYLNNHDRITENDFKRRIRIINNLIQNSEDEISDRADKNRIPAILDEVDYILMTGEINDNISSNFNINQLEEEKEKIAFLKEKPHLIETLFRLEDHSMLFGQISILGLDNLTYAERFESLFKCNWDKIDCALMAIGDYGQMEQNRWRYQYASSAIKQAWIKLFHKSSNFGFDKTRNILVKLLSMHKEFNDEILDKIAKNYTDECLRNKIFPFRYYYICYPEYRPGSYGKLSNGSAKDEPYMFAVLQTKAQWSKNAYIPFLKAADAENLSVDYMGQRLIYDNEQIICKNDSYICLKNNNIVYTIKINQNENGFDIEDRILKLKEYIRTLPKCN